MLTHYAGTSGSSIFSVPIPASNPAPAEPVGTANIDPSPSAEYVEDALGRFYIHSAPPPVLREPLHRYHRQAYSQKGKCAYVIYVRFSGGVFYNWWVLVLYALGPALIMTGTVGMLVRGL